MQIINYLSEAVLVRKCPSTGTTDFNWWIDIDYDDFVIEHHHYSCVFYSHSDWYTKGFRLCSNKFGNTQCLLQCFQTSQSASCVVTFLSLLHTRVLSLTIPDFDRILAPCRLRKKQNLRYERRERTLSFKFTTFTRIPRLRIKPGFKVVENYTAMWRKLSIQCFRRR